MEVDIDLTSETIRKSILLITVMNFEQLLLPSSNTALKLLTLHCVSISEMKPYLSTKQPFMPFDAHANANHIDASSLKRSAKQCKNGDNQSPPSHPICFLLNSVALTSIEIRRQLPLPLLPLPFRPLLFTLLTRRVPMRTLGRTLAYYTVLLDR